MKYLFSAIVKDGKLDFLIDQKELFKRHLRNISKNGEIKVFLSVEKLKEKRRLKQNNLYYLRLDVLNKITGYHKEELHSICLENCGFGDYVKIFDKIRFMRDSSAELTVDEFSRLMQEQDNILEFYQSDNDIKIQLPTTET